MTCTQAFQHTAARRRLVGKGRFYGQRWGFNTQPPEGGCQDGTTGGSGGSGFNTQPPEGGCARNYRKKVRRIVSTHSRPKAAEPLLKALFHQVSQPRFR